MLYTGPAVWSWSDGFSIRGGGCNLQVGVDFHASRLTAWPTAGWPWAPCHRQAEPDVLVVVCRNLDLGGNQLVGSVPKFLTGLTALSYVALYSTIHVSRLGFVIHACHRCRLLAFWLWSVPCRTLGLGDNALTGTLPSGLHGCVLGTRRFKLEVPAQAHCALRGLAV